VTPARIQRKKRQVAEKMKRREKRREEITAYHEMLREIAQESEKLKESKKVKESK